MTAPLGLPRSRPRRRSRACPRRLAALVALCALLAAALAPGAAAQFVAPEGSNFHNGSTLPLQDEGDAREQLHQLQDALERKDAGEAASLLRALRADHRVRLVPLGPRTDLPAIELAGRLIAHGDEAVRERIEAEARRDIAAARRTHDLDLLLDRATRATALDSAREAALLAARLLHERGEFWQAASLAARAGDLPGAAELAAASRARCAPPPGPLPAATAPPEEWHAQAFRAQDVNAEYVALPLIADARPGELLFLDGRGLTFLDETTGEPSARPLLWPEHVPRRGGEEVLAPTPRRQSLARAGDRLLIPFDVPRYDPPSPRQTRRSLLVAVDLLPAAPGSSASAGEAGGAPDTASLPEAARIAWMSEVPPGATAPGFAPAGAAPESAAPGDRGLDDFFERDEPPSVTLGPPRVAGPRVYAQVFRTGLTTQVSLACFELESGRLLFETPLVEGAQVQRFSSRIAVVAASDLDKRAREGPPVQRDGILYACTGFGVVAAVDGLTGLPRFTFRYDRIFSLDADTYDPAFLFDTGGWDDEPPRLWDERLVVAPGDSRFLYMLALEPGPLGDLILDDPIERMDRRHVVGLRPDPQGRPSPAVLASRRRAGAYGLVLLGPDGHVLQQSSLMQAGMSGAGRPILLEAPPVPQVLLPTSAGLVCLRRDDLAAPARVLPRAASTPAGVAAVFAVRNGVVTLAYQQTSRLEGTGLWLLQRYRPGP